MAQIRYRVRELDAGCFAVDVEKDGCVVEVVTGLPTRRDAAAWIDREIGFEPGAATRPG
jgi:hypothetical protein